MRELFEIRLLDQRIDGCLRGHAGASELEIDPGRAEPGASRLGLTGVSHRDERRDGEAAAGAFAGDRDASRLDALREEEGISAKRVLERCRKWMLGREAIIERERTPPACRPASAIM